MEKPKKIIIWFDTQDPNNKGWSYTAHFEEDILSDSLPLRSVRAGLRTLRRAVANDLKSFPREARSDGSWHWHAEDGGYWEWKA